ncbi:MAG: chromosome partitioning protein ParB [Candidatus Dojkabacteria bacterium]|nr:MAG: chromosome partitioning protein ParB [Candidatus Dojkabacteria bacterium]
MSLDTNKNRSLGRGLASLLPQNVANDIVDDNNQEGFRYLEIKKIIPNPYQPRQSIPIASILELSESIKEKGVMVPITVVPKNDGTDTYILVAGERRFSAAKLAGLDKIPAVVTQMTESEMAEAALIENIHRKDLNPIEEAYAFLRLVHEFGMTTDDIARKISKNKTYVESKIKLTELPKIVQNSIAVGEISENHGKVLLTLNDEKAIIAALKIVIRNNLSVRKTEELVREIKLETGKQTKYLWSNKYAEWFERYSYVKDGLSEITGCEIKLKRNRRNGGAILIHFNNDEELDTIYRKLVRKE